METNETTHIEQVSKAQQGWRVKLYELEPEGAWVDKGTGFVICCILPSLGCPALVVTSEESDDKILLQSKIQSEDNYEQQGGV